MMTARTLVPELLDELPPDDPRARRSRRDLARINALMGNDRLVARLLGSAPRRVLEIGAGDGRFMLRVTRRLSPGGWVTLLDRQPSGEAVHEDLRRVGWECETVVADVLDYLGRAEVLPFDAIVANLFLHHFEGARLAELLRLAAGKTDSFVACEPERSLFGLAGTRMLGLIAATT